MPARSLSPPRHTLLHTLLSARWAAAGWVYSPHLLHFHSCAAIKTPPQSSSVLLPPVFSLTLQPKVSNSAGITACLRQVTLFLFRSLPSLLSAAVYHYLPLSFTHAAHTHFTHALTHWVAGRLALAYSSRGIDEFSELVFIGFRAFQGTVCAPWHPTDPVWTIYISVSNSCSTSACVYWGFKLDSKKLRFIWRFQCSFSATASWLLKLYRSFQLAQVRFLSQPSKTRRMPRSSHGKSQSHLHFRPHPECHEYYGTACVQTHNGTALKNHKSLRWCENKPRQTVWLYHMPTHFTAVYTPLRQDFTTPKAYVNIFFLIPLFVFEVNSRAGQLGCSSSSKIIILVNPVRLEQQSKTQKYD